MNAKKLIAIALVATNLTMPAIPTQARGTVVPVATTAGTEIKVDCSDRTQSPPPGCPRRDT